MVEEIFLGLVMKISPAMFILGDSPRITTLFCFGLILLATAYFLLKGSPFFDDCNLFLDPDTSSLKFREST